MKAVLLSLVLVLSPTVALCNPSNSLDPSTQAILEQRFCQYLKSGLTLAETVKVIGYQVKQNLPAVSRLRRETGSGAEILYILADELVRSNTVAVFRGTLKNRCPEFLPRS